MVARVCVCRTRHPLKQPRRMDRSALRKYVRVLSSIGSGGPSWPGRPSLPPAVPLGRGGP